MRQTLEDVRQWFGKEVTATLDEGSLFEAFHRQHPSKVFLRNLPLGSRVLDIGAGDGSLNVFKSWPSPPRPDLKLYGFSMEKGSQFDRFEAYELGNWNEARPSFDGMKFDAIHCSNFIEHIKDPASLVEWAADRLTADGRIYIEWPAEESMYCPSLTQLAEMGFACITGNYFDDETHERIPPSAAFVRRRIGRVGLQVESAGVISMPFMEDELLAHFRAKGDAVSLQFAYWLHTGWMQYLVARRPRAPMTAGKLAFKLKSRFKRPADASACAEAMRARTPGKS